MFQLLLHVKIFIISFHNYDLVAVNVKSIMHVKIEPFGPFWSLLSYTRDGIACFSKTGASTSALAFQKFFFLLLLFLLYKIMNCILGGLNMFGSRSVVLLLEDHLIYTRDIGNPWKSYPSFSHFLIIFLMYFWLWWFTITALPALYVCQHSFLTSQLNHLWKLWLYCGFFDCGDLIRDSLFCVSLGPLFFVILLLSSRYTIFCFATSTFDSGKLICVCILFKIDGFNCLQDVDLLYRTCHG